MLFAKTQALATDNSESIVIIQPNLAYSIQSAFGSAANFSLKRQTTSDVTATIADTTTISQAAQRRLTSEKAGGLQAHDERIGIFQECGLLPSEKTIDSSVHSTNALRIEGPVYSLEDIAKSKGRSLVTYKMTDAQLDEAKLREQQDMAREIANFNYAKAHQYQPEGQVLVNGKVFATVFDSGSFEMAHALPGLSDESLSPADRLAEIALAVKGQIISSDLQPTLGGWSGASAPESMLPPVTARSFQEIFDQEIRPTMERDRQAEGGTSHAA